MFERYTEHARRAIFYARHSASLSGSPKIQSEHLLLGLLCEAGPLIPHLAPGVSIERLYQRIPKNVVIGETVVVPITVPLSPECKRILTYSMEEADSLNHRCIGAEHLLLAILREEKCTAARLLVEAGIRLESVREILIAEMARHRGADALEWVPTEVGRETIHAMIDQLPETMLGCAKMAIDHMLSASRPASKRRSPRRYKTAEHVGAGGGDESKFL